MPDLVKTSEDFKEVIKSRESSRNPLFLDSTYNQSNTHLTDAITFDSNLIKKLEIPQ